jgi:molybdenum cofactor synthesis domain-containing protein
VLYDEKNLSRPTGEAMSENNTVTACVLVIGNEILSGRTQDLNLQYIGTRLNELGVRLREARVIPDLPEVIIATVNECRAKYDYVFTSGGIGPTHDDITSECIAAAFGVALHKHPDAMALLEPYYPPGEFTEARQRMATVPEGAELIHNPVSAAPGFRVENVYVLAGIPSIMRAMFETVTHQLTGGAPMLSRSVRVAVGESVLAEGLGELQRRYPDIDIGSYPAVRRRQFGVSLVLRGTDADLLDRVMEELKDMLRGLGAEPEEEITDPTQAVEEKA